VGTKGVAGWAARRRHGKAWATVRTPRGREDLRGQLAAMRKLAYRLGWLDRSIDPLDGSSFLVADYLDGTTGMVISPYLRPGTRQVEAMARAADLLCKQGSAEPRLARTALLGTQLRVASYGGLRLGEQLALRAVDVSSLTMAGSTSTAHGSPRASKMAAAIASRSRTESCTRSHCHGRMCG